MSHISRVKQDRRQASILLSMLGLVLSWALPALSQDIACRAEVNRTSVPRGETLSLTVTAEGALSWSADFRLPEIPGVQIFGGGTNQSVTYVNGQTMTTVAKSYYLQVDTDEDFVISPITVTSDGKSCSTEPITIKVGPAAQGGSVPPADSGNRVAAPPDRGQTEPQPGDGAGDDIFITLEVDRDEVWLGQQLILSFKYFRRIQPWNNPQFTAPRTEGFWREDLGQERRYRSVVKGRSYTVTEIRYALFPTRSGTLTIEPAELAFPDQGLERFFSSRRRRGPRTLRTDPVAVTVKPLPAGQPAGFSGLVASRVGLESAVDREKVPRGEPVSWKVQLISDGFLKGFGGLDIPEITGGRSHDAGENFATQVENGALLSAITVEKVIVPAEEGLLDVPSVELSWFDAGAGRYRVSRSSPRRVRVDPSDLPYLPEEDSGFLRSEVARLAQDLAFIHNVPARLGSGSWKPLTSVLWWALLLLPLLLLGIWRWYLQRLSALHGDPAARRKRGALQAARRALDQVPGEGTPEAQLAQLNRAVKTFVADCQNLPPAAVGPREVEEYCASLSEPEAGRRLRLIMEQSESTRFSGGEVTGSGQEGTPKDLAREAGQLIEAVARRQSLKPIGGVTGLSLSLLMILVIAASAVPGRASAEADPLRLMAEGNQAYTAGDLDATLQLYQQVADMGVEDPVLYFNLGNTYARRGELGQAVVSYLRAQRLDPRDPDIADNLAWVRGHITDLELAEEPLPLFVAQLVWLARFFTVGEWAVALVILVWLGSALLGWAWYRGGFSEPMRRSGLLLGALLLGTLAVFAWGWHGQEVRAQAVVIVSEVSVLSGPADSFPVLFKVHDGLTVFLEGHQQGWARISLGGESLGWLPLAAVEPVNPDHRPDR